MPEFGISILSAGPLAGLGNLKMVTSPDAIKQAALAAHTLGLGVQLVPLSTMGLWSLDNFQELLFELVDKEVVVMSFEDRWGGADWRHPWLKDFRDRKFAAVAAYYLLWPWKYREVKRRLALLQEDFPEAIPVDLPGGPKEIDLHKGSLEVWTARFRLMEVKEEGVVLDTFHFLEFPEREQQVILRYLVEREVPVKLLHVQFRDQHHLQVYLAESIRSPTRRLLKGLVTEGAVGELTKVIFELDPGLVDKTTLTKLVDVTRRLLS